MFKKAYSALPNVADTRGYWLSLHISLTARCLQRGMMMVNHFITIHAACCLPQMMENGINLNQVSFSRY